MDQRYNPTIKPGVLEVYCGPMKSGKTREIINRIDKLRYMNGYTYKFFKPEIDNRETTLKSRFGDLSYEVVRINEDKPHNIFRYLNPSDHLVVIDEIQFFCDDIVSTLEYMLKDNKNIIAGGLDLDFRGEHFGCMPKVLSIANEVYKLTAICEHQSGCNSHATRSQRLIDGKPAHYNSDIVLIDDQRETYQARCINHHEVPGKTV